MKIDAQPLAWFLKFRCSHVLSLFTHALRVPDQGAIGPMLSRLVSPFAHYSQKGLWSQRWKVHMHARLPSQGRAGHTAWCLA